MRLWPIIPHKTKVAIDLWRSQPLWLYFITNKIILKPWCETHRGFLTPSPTAWCHIFWCLLPSFFRNKHFEGIDKGIQHTLTDEIFSDIDWYAPLRKRLSATMYFSCWKFISLFCLYHQSSTGLILPWACRWVESCCPSDRKHTRF